MTVQPEPPIKSRIALVYNFPQGEVCQFGELGEDVSPDDGQFSED